MKPKLVLTGHNWPTYKPDGFISDTWVIEDKEIMPGLEHVWMLAMDGREYEYRVQPQTESK